MPDISASFPTRTLAKDWARKKESEMKESRYFRRDEGNIHTFFASFVDLYIEKNLPKNPKDLAKNNSFYDRNPN